MFLKSEKVIRSHNIVKCNSFILLKYDFVRHKSQNTFMLSFETARGLTIRSSHKSSSCISQTFTNNHFHFLSTVKVMAYHVLLRRPEQNIYIYIYIHEGWNFNFDNTPLAWIQELLEWRAKAAGRMGPSPTYIHNGSGPSRNGHTQ